MRNKRALVALVALSMIATSCGLFGGDDAGTDLSTAETFTAEPTANVVQAVPADDTAAEPTAVAAAAPLPTAVTIPATAVPPEPTPDRSQPTTYVVQSGDVLGLIAERFDVDIAELRRVNDLSGNLIRVGQTLTIPALEGTAPAVDESASGTSTEVVGSTSASTGSTAPAPEPTPVSCGSNAVGHCVQSGDSLLGIASSYGVSVDSLRSANPGIVGDVIRIGDLITIPGQSGSSSGDSSTGGTPIVGTTTEPTVVVQPQSDADCAARNAAFPYFHAADGLCYANPIGPTVEPTSSATNTQPNDVDTTCPSGTFLWDDGLCYPIPGATPTPTPDVTPTPVPVSVDYGDGPNCDAWEEVLNNNKCWPSTTATAQQILDGCVSGCD